MPEEQMKKFTTTSVALASGLKRGMQRHLHSRQRAGVNRIDAVRADCVHAIVP
jgi:hypothetical protein